MADIGFRTGPTARDVARVSSIVLLRHPMSLFAMAAGPTLWFAGWLLGSVQVARVGLTLMPVAVLIPVFALLSGQYSARRPGTAELYVPTEWLFGDDGVEVVQPERTAHAEWSEFRSWRVAADCYVLDLSRTRYLVLPQRDVPEETRPDFERLLADRIGPRVR